MLCLPPVDALPEMAGAYMSLAFLLLLLIILNGIFAMAEIALVSSRKARLQKMADDGEPGSSTALALHDEPSNFLSTVQVGITTIGILSGVVGDDACPPR